MKIEPRLIISFYSTILVPFLYLANLLVVYKAKDTILFGDFTRLMGLLVSLVGMILWIKSYKDLGGSFAVLPREQKRVKKGVYSRLSHPMYMGIGLTFAGLAIANQSLAGILFTLFLTAPLLVLRAIIEEKKLVE